VLQHEDEVEGAAPSPGDHEAQVSVAGAEVVRDAFSGELLGLLKMQAIGDLGGEEIS
jgi:hypothetical protein